MAAGSDVGLAENGVALVDDVGNRGSVAIGIRLGVLPLMIGRWPGKPVGLMFWNNITLKLLSQTVVGYLK